MDLAPLVLSFEVATLATAAAGAAGLALAALLANGRFPGRDVLDVAVTAPLVLPPTVLGYYLLVAFGRRSPLGEAFEAVTGSQLVFTRAGAVLAATVGALPLVVKGARASLEAVDPTLTSAARTLGAGPLRALLTVQVPLAGRGLAAAAMLAFARALGDFGMTLMVAGDVPGRTRTASLAIYDALQDHHDDVAAGLAAAMTAAALAILYGVNKLAAAPADGR